MNRMSVSCIQVVMAGALFVLVAAGTLLAVPLPAVPQVAVNELGVEQGLPCMSGFVFIEGRYIPPPYTVTRRGNGIFINRIQVDQPIPWSYFESDSEIDSVSASVKHDEDDKFMSAADTVPSQQSVADGTDQSKRVATIDDLFADDEGPTAAQEAAGQPQVITTIDDLFSDNETDGAPSAENKSSEVDSLTNLFSDDAALSATQRERTIAERTSPSTRSAPKKLSAAQIRERKETLKRSLDEKRAFYERALVKGELYFFGGTHHKINGTYGTARTLLEVLPEALRHSRTPAELQSRLRDGGVYFVDINVCQALYRHKTTFPLLQQRLEKIQREEAIQAANQKRY